jgi:hypothetical protein
MPQSRYPGNRDEPPGGSGTLDVAMVQLCAWCLSDAAAAARCDDDVALTAVAVARDLADTSPAQAPELLDAASRCAATHLDTSDLDRAAFAQALRRLAEIHDRSAARLVAAGLNQPIRL